jgi:uncharacterized protein (DUF2336 family)
MPQNVPDNAERLAAVPASQRHSVLIRSLADLFALVPEHLPEDIERFEALFRPLYAEAEAADRRAVVATLARRRDLPVSVAEDILADAADIAALYLEAAPAPDETALLHAVVRGAPEIRRLIARRPHLSEPVVLALLVAGEDEVVAELADNPTAEIPEHLIEALEDEADAQARPELPASLARFLAKDDGERLADLDARIAAASLLQVESAGRTPRRAAPADLFAKACAGDRAGIATDLAAALDLAPDVATAIVDDKGGEALAVALAAAGVDNTQATSLFVLLLPEETRHYWRLTLLRDLHERTGWRAGAEILEHWRAGPRPQAATALRQLDAAERPAQLAPRRRLLRPADLAARRA